MAKAKGSPLPLSLVRSLMASFDKVMCLRHVKNMTAVEALGIKIVLVGWARWVWHRDRAHNLIIW